jgi:hypothetical protein
LGRLLILDVDVILVAIHGILIEYFGCTLEHVSTICRGVLFQSAKSFLKGLLSGSLEGTRYGNSVMSLAPFSFRAAMNLPKAFANSNVVASRRGRYELEGIMITNTSKSWALHGRTLRRCVLMGVEEETRARAELS